MKKIQLPTLNLQANRASVAAAVLALGTCASAQASDLAPLSLNQLDMVSAGSAQEIAGVAEGTASAVSDLLALSGVRTDAVASSSNEGDYQIDTVFVSGVSYACCSGGETSLDLAVSSDADTQVGIARIYSIESPLVSIKIGAAGLIGFTRR